MEGQNMSEGFISRAFRGRRQKSDVAGRLPPGQYLERGFPVLSAGPTPHTPLERWDFSIGGNVKEPKRTLALPTWMGHRAGQHVDVRLTAEDGYQAERSYSIASPPEEEHRLTLTVERLDDGEVSPYLTSELRAGDKLELRGPIGGYFVWETHMGGPLLLIAGGSGIVPLMAMLRHRAAVGSTIPTRLLYSSRSFEDVI